VQVLQCIAGAENLLAGQFMVPRSSRLQRNRDRETGSYPLPPVVHCASNSGPGDHPMMRAAHRWTCAAG